MKFLILVACPYSTGFCFNWPIPMENGSELEIKKAVEVYNRILK